VFYVIGDTQKPSIKRVIVGLGGYFQSLTVRRILYILLNSKEEDCEGKFTDEGLKTLFEHLHKQGDTEFDAVQICNGWKEYHDINIANSLRHRESNLLSVHRLLNDLKQFWYHRVC
jgi:hypothetical protein